MRRSKWKPTPEQLADIRANYATVGQRKMADKYGVPTHVMNRVAQREGLVVKRGVRAHAHPAARQPRTPRPAATALASPLTAPVDVSPAIPAAEILRGQAADIPLAGAMHVRLTLGALTIEVAQ